jgi:hypothetical protein
LPFSNTTSEIAQLGRSCPHPARERSLRMDAGRRGVQHKWTYPVMTEVSPMSTGHDRGQPPAPRRGARRRRRRRHRPGFAGLVAARELGRAGLDVLVLEARDLVGGRTWTDRRLGHDLELGGTWVHWVQPHTWAEMTRSGSPVTGCGGSPSTPNHDRMICCSIPTATHRTLIGACAAPRPRRGAGKTWTYGLFSDRGDREATSPAGLPPTRRIRKVSLDSSLSRRPELHCEAQLSTPAPRSLYSDRTLSRRRLLSCIAEGCECQT